MKQPKLISGNNQSGFTIIEFLISSVGFTAVLLIMTFGIIDFMVDYYKVTLSATVQTSATNISTTIERSIELSSSQSSVEFISPSLVTVHAHDCPAGYLGTPPNCTEPGYFCTSTEEFSFFLGEEVPYDSSYALYQLPLPSSGCTPDPQYDSPASSSAWTDGRSLLGNNYRLINFNVQPVGSLPEETIILKIAYTSGGTNNTGDDLLCVPGQPASSPGSCSPGSPNLTDFTNSSIVCKGQK